MRKRTFTVVIECENEAFEDDPGPEIARILRWIATALEDGGPLEEWETIHDLNDNPVGHYGLTR
jgi:hypothetical protein